MDSAVIVCDLCNLESFNNLKNYLDDIHQYSKIENRVLLFGNKRDATDKTVVFSKQGEQIAKRHSIKFYETSAYEDPSSFFHQIFISFFKSIFEAIYQA